MCLLMGGDAFLKLHTWHFWKQLFELTHIVVMQRGGSRPIGNSLNEADADLRSEYHARLGPSPRALRDSPAGSILVLDMPALDISASDIRRRLAEEKDSRYLLPDAVTNYIQTYHLYT